MEVISVSRACDVCARFCLSSRPLTIQGSDLGCIVRAARLCSMMQLRDEASEAWPKRGGGAQGQKGSGVAQGMLHERGRATIALVGSEANLRPGPPPPSSHLGDQDHHGLTHTHTHTRPRPDCPSLAPFSALQCLTFATITSDPRLHLPPSSTLASFYSYSSSFSSCFPSSASSRLKRDLSYVQRVSSHRD
ncbi:hypothetical protein BCV69DRAFT_16284 [Microstroma glucosiphilum]|uniref:Uncharacterized protein n=1 Tax=Pseudomicrostroma glucosiphilum TaxID=1684307 RepID=A0A316UFG9_9BASI|nr:hypothetical protein BCV69DRAFT_16284 [Pseudomicrostroma glucosiphilum]PWN23996.1 hypothetical protein BCV69DRAFT_16284 [Pseudomicrostroma glucosiphilum]